VRWPRISSPRTSTGKDVRLSDFKGKIVILDFRADLVRSAPLVVPDTQEVAAKYKDQDVIVLASGTSDTIEKFKKWIPENQSKYPDLRFTYDVNERGAHLRRSRFVQALPRRRHSHAVCDRS